MVTLCSAEGFSCIFFIWDGIRHHLIQYIVKSEQIYFGLMGPSMGIDILAGSLIYNSGKKIWGIFCLLLGRVGSKLYILNTPSQVDANVHQPVNFLDMQPFLAFVIVLLFYLRIYVLKQIDSDLIKNCILVNREAYSMQLSLSHIKQDNCFSLEKTV